MNNYYTPNRAGCNAAGSTKLSHRGFLGVIPAQAGIQGIQLTVFWIALTLLYVHRLRGNDEGFKLTTPRPLI